MQGPDERDVILHGRAAMASRTREYLEEWQGRTLRKIDTEAKIALEKAELLEKAYGLWVQRILVLRLMESIERDERRGEAASARLERSLA